MNFITKQKEDLLELVKQVAANKEEGLSIDEYLFSLQKRSISLARIVHRGQKDKAGKPYIQHPMRLAGKTTNLVGFCSAMLHDVVEDGKELGITLDFLRNEMDLPNVIVNAVDALSRRDGETYGDYLKRLVLNYQAAKVKIDDGIDNSNIARFDLPSHSDMIRCQKYLERVCSLKSKPEFQHQQVYDIVMDLMAMNRISPMVYHMEEDNDGGGNAVYHRIYFGYEGCQERRYVLTMNSLLNQDGTFSLHLNTYSSVVEYANRHVYLPVRTIMKFNDKREMQEYMANVYRLIEINALQLQQENVSLWHSPSKAITAEKYFMHSLDNFHA